LIRSRLDQSQRLFLLMALSAAVAVSLAWLGSTESSPGADVSDEAAPKRVAIAERLREANSALGEHGATRAARAVLRYSAKYDLEPDLVTAVLLVESTARPWARSPKGAVGLMQVMPHMAERLGLAGSLASIESNIEAGCWILADNIRRLGEEDGISAYFWGSDIRGVVYLERVKKARAAVRGLSES
jgi:soluble lytic murein transglycosylase-like protein